MFSRDSSSSQTTFSALLRHGCLLLGLGKLCRRPEHPLHNKLWWSCFSNAAKNCPVIKARWR